MRPKSLSLIITFDTTSRAMAAERLFADSRLPGRMIPVPREITAGCGLAWKGEESCRSVYEDLLRGADIAYADIRVMLL